MKAVQLTQPATLVEKDVPVPSVGPSEVLVKVFAVGLCGTDISIYRGISPVPYPIVLGHEFSGVIAETGSGVRSVAAGDTVISEASWGCGTCFFCKKGLPSYCEQPLMYGRTCDGALAEYVKAPERVIHKISPKVSPIDGQAATAVATALRAVRRAGVSVGRSVVILGAGHSGAMLLQVARLAGASPIIVGEVIDERLRLAISLGADLGVNVRETGWMEQIRRAMDGQGPDIVIEATGRPDAVSQSVELVRKGGTVLVFGIIGLPVPDFPAKNLYYKDISIIGNKGGYFEYGNAVRLIETGRIQVRKLVTRVFPFPDTALAFDLVTRKPQSFLRAVVTVDEAVSTANNPGSGFAATGTSVQ